LSGKSKKVSEFSDSALQVGQTIHEIRHADYSRLKGEGVKANGGKMQKVKK
jgi:hypothetical protein